jgi:hypothetical protein
VSERWPRLMKRKTAAEYCDMSIPSFERQIIAGNLPASVVMGRTEYWCRNALDKALDALTGAGDEPDYRKEMQERYGPKAA